MSQALINLIGGMFGRGAATGGTKTTLIDTRKTFEADLFNGYVIKMSIGGTEYYRKITDTADSTLTFATLPGTAATATWTIDTGVTIGITAASDGNIPYTLEAALAEEETALSAVLVGTTIQVTLATDAEGAGVDAANTATLVTAAVHALEEFSAELTGSGATVVAPTETAVAFSGGVDEVKPLNQTSYVIMPYLIT